MVHWEKSTHVRYGLQMDPNQPTTGEHNIRERSRPGYHKTDRSQSKPKFSHTSDQERTLSQDTTEVSVEIFQMTTSEKRFRSYGLLSVKLLLIF